MENAFGSGHSEITAVTQQPIFQHTGDLLIQGIIDWMFENKVIDSKKLQGEFVQRFFKWYADVLKQWDTRNFSALK